MKRIISHIIAYTVLIVAIVFLIGANSNKRQNLSRLSSDLYVLHDSVRHYRVLDSLNAAQVTALRLRADEYADLYAGEQELVRKLRADKAGLMATIVLQEKTIISLQASLQPVIIYDTIGVPVDTIPCFEHHDKWLDVSGCVVDDTVQLEVAQRDEIFIVESAQRKRFLGISLPIKWFGYKTRTVDVMSLNPNATIETVTYKTIEQ